MFITISRTMYFQQIKHVFTETMGECILHISFNNTTVTRLQAILVKVELTLNGSAWYAYTQSKSVGVLLLDITTKLVWHMNCAIMHLSGFSEYLKAWPS